MKNWIQTKANSTRTNYALLSALVLLPCVLVFGLFHIYRDTGELENSLHRFDAALLAEQQQIDTAQLALTEFKQQIQEWKNVLLRGGESAHETLHHWAKFEQQETRVRAALEALRAGMQNAHEDEETAEVTDALVLHHFIGEQYRNALARHPLGQGATAAFTIDRMMRGLDRPLTAQLEGLIERNRRQYQAQSSALDATHASETQAIRSRIRLTMIFILLMILAEAALVFRKISEGKINLARLTAQGEQTVYHLAYLDTLTGLPNRRLFQDRFERAIALSQRTGQYGAVLFLDMDNFKTLNDTKGHGVGDLLLVEVAQRLKECVRESDTVARLGGDEFVVILDDLSKDGNTAAEQAAMISQKISTALNRPYQLNQLTHSSSSSIGVALFCDGNTSVDEVLMRADTAMYQAKHAGRNTVRFFDPRTQAALEARSNLEHALRTAVDGRQLQLYYQVQVNEDRLPIGAEALLRWVHPNLGTILPEQFVPLAEETGLILPIGHWVLENACAQLKQWGGNPGTRDLALSVNVSRSQFREEEGFVAQVRSLLDSNGIDPALLKLEITESMAMHDVEHTIGIMRQLKRLGVSFSLDDFGTGHSSLSNLKRLPLDQIKIDQSFVHDLATNSNDAAIVKTIIAMAHSMKLDVIAEGVETEEQRQFLAIHGCNAFQGYLFGKPVPGGELGQALLKFKN